MSSVEEWKDVVGYEGIYQVSNHGRVKSVGRWIYRKDRVKSGYLKESLMTPSPGKSGHMRVNLRRNNQTDTVYVHRLVLEAFIGSCPDGMEACHADDNPANNNLDNLRWDTRPGNIEDRRKNGVLVIGENATGAKLTFSKVAEIKRRLALGERGAVLAKEYDISPSVISEIKTGKGWAHV